MRHLIDGLLMTAPNLTKVATHQAVQEFMKVAESAKKAKSLEKMKSSYNQLKGYYQ